MTQNVKPFSYFPIIGKTVLLLYSGWFFSNQATPSKDGIWYYVSFTILLSGPALIILLHKLDLCAIVPSGQPGVYDKIHLLPRLLIRVLLVILFGMHIKICLLERYTVIGSSMEPGLMDGDVIWAEKLTAGIPLPDLSFPVHMEPQKLLYGSYRRGEIVIFHYPGMTENHSEYFIKRIIALPGDRFRFTDLGVEINGVLLDERYVKNSSSPYNTDGYQPPVFTIPVYLDRMDSMVKYSAINGCGREGTVPEDSLLLLGDNRSGSRDSRSVGFVPVLFVSGKLISSGKTLNE